MSESSDKGHLDTNKFMTEDDLSIRILTILGNEVKRTKKDSEDIIKTSKKSLKVICTVFLSAQPKAPYSCQVLHLIEDSLDYRRL